MAPKRGDRVAPPAGHGEWEVRFAAGEAVKGWDALCHQAPAKAAAAWREFRAGVQRPAPTSRHHQLKGRLATATHRGIEMEQRRYEVTAAGRIWYLVDTVNRTLWLRHAGPGHPKSAE